MGSGACGGDGTVFFSVECHRGLVESCLDVLHVTQHFCFRLQILLFAVFEVGLFEQLQAVLHVVGIGSSLSSLLAQMLQLAHGRFPCLETLLVVCEQWRGVAHRVKGLKEKIFFA